MNWSPHSTSHPIHLNGEVPSVHVVPQEEVASLVRRSSNVKQLYQVIELTVNVTTHSEGGFDLQHGGLGAEQSSSCVHWREVRRGGVRRVKRVEEGIIVRHEQKTAMEWEEREVWEVCTDVRTHVVLDGE